MEHFSELQLVLGLNRLPVDIRVVVQAAIAIAVLLYALALRHRRGSLHAWPVAVIGAAVGIDLLTPLIGQSQLGYVIDTSALILFLCGIIRVALELADAASHRGREHFSTIFRDLLTLALWAFVVMVVLREYFKIDVTALLAIPAVITVVIGLALQETLGNIFSGLSLQLSQPFQPGDWVRSADKIGRVRGVGWRATTIVTRGNERVDIPNAQLAKEVLFNYASHVVADEISVGISYSEPPNRVREVVLGVLRDIPAILHHPGPDVFAWEFGDSAIRYRVKYWLSDFGEAEHVRDRVVSSLWYALRRHGIDIPFPIRTLKLSREIRVADDERQRLLMAELRGVDFLRELSEDEMRILSYAACVRQFGAGELLVRQGDIGDSLYIIRRGVVDVSAAGADGHSVHLTELTRAAFFGEMGLMTGEPRNATIRARGDVEVIEMPREGFIELFKAHPEAAAKMSEVIAARMSQRRELLDAGQTVDGGTHGRSRWLLDKMRAIFDI